MSVCVCTHLSYHLAIKRLFVIFLI